MTGVLPSRSRARASATRAFMIASALVATACERDITAPERGLVLVTHMPAALESLSPTIAAQVAPFDKVRLTLTRLTGATAVDETFSVGAADPIEVELQVPLSLNVPLLGELMTLVVSCIDPAGDVVYRGGPVAVLIKPGAATPPVDIQLAYVGNGSLAATLEIVPNALSVLLGQVFSFTAIARDAQGAEIPGAPVVWSVLDPLLATLTSPLGGIGTALGLPGTARVIAQVPDGPADTALLTIDPLPQVERLLQLVSGGGQSGLIGALLGSPIVVRVVDGAAQPLSGIPVSFSATNGGILGTPSALSSAAGLAQTTWTLGSLLGTQTLTATAQGLTGPALTVPASGLPIIQPVATALQVPTTLATTVAGTLLSSNFVVRAVDAAGNVVPGYANPITVALGNNPGGATLLGTRTVTPSNGIATFDDLSLQKAASGYTLVATASGLTNATSNAFSVTNAAASVMSIVSGNNQSALLGVLLGSPLSVRVADAFGNPVAGVPVAWAVSLGGGLLGNSTTQTNASGIATNTWTLGLLAGLQRVTASVNGLTGSPSTFSATGLLPIEPVATALEIPTTLTSRVAGTVLPTFVVRAVDESGDVVPSYTNAISVALGNNPGGAALLGTRTVAPSNGVATFDDLSLQKAASGYTLVASATGLTGATSNAFNISNAAASVASIVSGNDQSALVGTLLGNPLSVRVTDAFANPVAGFPVNWAITLGGGLLGNATTQTNASGVATNTWTLGLLAGIQRVTASGSGLSPPAVFDATGLPIAQPVATALQMTTGVATTVAGIVLSTNFIVRALDAVGNVVPGFTSPISVALGSNPGGATLLGTRTVTPTNGIATFDDLSLQKAASGYTLVATATGLTSATSNAFTITNAAAAVMSLVSGNNQSALVGALLGSPLSLRVTDAFSNPVAGVPVAWAATLGGGSLGNSTTQTNASGIATNTWTLGLLAGLQRATASVTGLSGSPSTFSATGLPLPNPVATALEMVTTVSSGVAGAALVNLVVRAVDEAGDVVPTYTNAITVALGQNPGGATLLGTRTVAPTNGVATFDNLSLEKAASGYTIVATASGLTGATSNAFSITNAAAAILATVSGNNQSALVGALLGNPLSVRVTDAFGNPVAGTPVAWAATLGGGALGNSTTQTNASGIATNTWTLGLLAGLQRATASVSGLSGSPSTFTATGLPLPDPVATALQIPTTLTSRVAGTVLSPSLVVRAVDESGNIVPNFTNPITVALGNNPGGATLLGTRTVTPSSGVATFDDLSLQKVGSGYTLVATASGLTGATSNAFSITNAAASVLSIVSGNNQSATIGALLGAPLSVRVTDAFENPVAGVPVAWAVSLGGGLLGNATTQTSSSGVATNTWSLGLLAGLQRVTASVNGLSGSPAIFNATGLLGLPLGRSR